MSPASLTHFSAQPHLLPELQQLFGAHRAAFGQERVFRRAWFFLLAWLLAFGRKTLTQLLLALGWLQDGGAWYRFLSRRRVDYDQLTALFFAQTLRHVPVEEPYRVVLDATSILRHSRKMPGTFWGRAAGGLGVRANLRRMQRFEHLAWLWPAVEGYTRAVPLRWFSALPPKAVPVPGEPVRREWEAGLAALRWARTQLDAARREGQWLLAVADGTYDVNDLWREVPHHTVLLVRCAKNRRLYCLPERKPGRGRPAVYGDPAPTPQEWLHQRGAWQPTTLTVRGRPRPLKYRVVGPYVVEGSGAQPLFLLVVKGYTAKSRSGRALRYRPPSYLLVNAVQEQGTWVLPRPAAELLTWAWQRWEVEVCHRELKTDFGVGELQCWSAASSLLSVQWAVWLYAVLVLAGYRAWGGNGQPVSPPGRWWRGGRRWSLNTLWQGYRQELWRPAEFQALCSGSPGKWPEIPDFLQGLWNVAWSTVRG